MTFGFSGKLLVTAAVMAAVTATGSCQAQESSMQSSAIPAPLSAATPAVETVYGLWSISEGMSVCRLALSVQTIDNAHQAVVERCRITALADGRAWRTVPGGFELLGPANRVLAKFRMTGVDTFESIDGKLEGERASET